MKLSRLASSAQLSGISTLRTQVAKRIPDEQHGRPSGSWSSRKRWNMWRQKPYCAACGVLMDWPQGVELDHITPLHMGGSNEDSNLQLLCVWFDGPQRAGCHHVKTQEERR